MSARCCRRSKNKKLENVQCTNRRQTQYIVTQQIALHQPQKVRTNQLTKLLSLHSPAFNKTPSRKFLGFFSPEASTPQWPRHWGFELPVPSLFEIASVCVLIADPDHPTFGIEHLAFVSAIVVNHTAVVTSSLWLWGRPISVSLSFTCALLFLFLDHLAKTFASSPDTGCCVCYVTRDLGAGEDNCLRTTNHFLLSIL